jgi:hypothetical protein
MPTYPGDPCNIYSSSLTPTSTQLEAEWVTNWRPYVLADEGPYLFSELSFAAFANPTIVKLYTRDRAGRWSLIPDGAVTITALDPTDGSWAARYLVGGGCSGFVWVSDHAGTAVTTRGGVGREG